MGEVRLNLLELMELLELLQLLRQHRYPVKGTKLASMLGVSVRTLYRDIKTLQNQGATIEGEPVAGLIPRFAVVFAVGPIPPGLGFP